MKQIILCSLLFFVMSGCKNNYKKLQDYIKSNNINEIENIVKSGKVNLNKPLPNGEFPLIFSIEKDNYLTTKTLIEFGASTNNYGDTIPLFFAVKNDNLQIINLLIDNNADISKLNGKNQNLLFYTKSKKTAKLLMDELNVNQQDTLGETPLYNAIKNDNKEMIDLFLNKKGVDIYKKNNTGTSILDLAKEKKNNELVKTLSKRIKSDNWPQKGDVVYIYGDLMGTVFNTYKGIVKKVVVENGHKYVYVGSSKRKFRVNQKAFRYKKSLINYWTRNGYRYNGY